MPQFIIRKAELKDCSQILSLVKELAKYERAPQEVTVSLEHFQESGFGKNPFWWGHVAETLIDDEMKIIGIAVYYIRFSTWKGQTLYLEDIVVTEDYRRYGIGQKLFDAVKMDAQKLKFPFMRWQVLEWNEPAIAFYKKNKADLDPEWVNCTLKVE